MYIHVYSEETKSFTNNMKHFEMPLVLQRETSITIVVAKFETNLPSWISFTIDCYFFRKSFARFF